MSDNRVRLQTSDEVFEVEVDVACHSRVLRDAIKCNGTGSPIQLRISDRILRKVIDYCRYHVAFNKVIAHSLNSARTLDGRLDHPDGLRLCHIIYDLTQQMDRWDERFVQVDADTLVDIILAADYLDIQDLVYLTWLNVREEIYTTTRQDIRMFFERKNDLLELVLRMRY